MRKGRKAGCRRAIGTKEVVIRSSFQYIFIDIIGYLVTAVSFGCCNICRVYTPLSVRRL